MNNSENIEDDYTLDKGGVIEEIPTKWKNSHFT